MPKLLLTIILLVTSNYIFSQNWSIVRLNTNYFFDLDSSQNIQGVLEEFSGFKVDSTYIIGGDTFYIHSKKLSPNPSGFIPCDTLVESSFGVMTIKNSNSTKVININNDTFYFPKLNSHANNWKLIEFPNGQFISAQVFNSDTITFKNNLDSIIRVRLTKRDSSNAMIGSIDDTISILKSTGWFQTLNWTYYLDTSKALHYTRSSFELMRKSEIYDFDVNDEFHISINENNGPIDYLNIKILSKNIQGDSVTYTREIDRESNIYDGSIWPPIRTSYNHYTDTVTYSNINQLIGGLPQAFSSDSTYTHSLHNMTSNQTNRYGYTLSKPDYHYQFENKYCYSSSSTERTFMKGCGSVDYKSDNVNGSPNFTLEQLIYYKKGSQTWGNPHIITNIPINRNSKSQFKVYPNPAKNKIQIELINPTEYARIFDLNGRLLKYIQFPQSPNLSIDISDIDIGLYIIELKLSNGKTLNKKLIINR